MLRVVATSSVVLLLTGSLAAQISAPAKVYRTQYLELRAKATTLLERSRQANSTQAKMNLQEEGLALTKLVHRLGEEAARDNMERMQRSQPTDKSLSLVVLGCSALDFLLQSTDHYLDTGDLAFLQLAKQGASLMDSVEGFF